MISDSWTNVKVNVLYDSKKRPHHVAILGNQHGIACVDLDANTYKE